MTQLSGPEIQLALQKFVGKWEGYSGSERSEAQSFLNELFSCYGTDRRAVGALFEDFTASAGFMDLHWPGILIVEMKAPQVPLEKAKEQRRRYRQESSDSVNDNPAARFVIACNFGHFEIEDRGAAPIDEIQRFTMQQNPHSARDIGHLFTLLNQKGNHNRQGPYAGTRYVNGELFAKPAAVFMNRDELLHLRDAAELNWKAVDPTIFGSLMEGVLGEERRERLRAHYTHEADIMKIVTPTILRPWRERIEVTTTPSEARALLDELCDYTVLDPACGCGNFLYVAYRELRGLEFELIERIHALAADTGIAAPIGLYPYFPLANIRGIDIERIAVLIARMTLWMGHRQMVDRYGEAEPVLPLIDLSGIRAADALRVDWPEVDAIIGNPPFVGSQHTRANLSGDYVEWLKGRFGTGVKDLCVHRTRRHSRAKKALVRVCKGGGDHDIELALAEVVADLEPNHKRFMQDPYYAGDTLRLI